MATLDDQLALTRGDHRQALEWFRDNAGKTVPWPKPLPTGLVLASKAKGIRVPEGWNHALSVRQSLDGPYADREVEFAADGSWSYDYYQEGIDPGRRDDFSTNRALLRNMRDGVPVGALIQVKKKPNPRYRVLGLAQVSSWAGGYFRLDGYNTTGQVVGASDNTPTDVLLAALNSDPVDLTDARKRINAAIVARQGAGAFRKAALHAFGGRCAVTDCDVPDVLEAAHIVPYLGKATNVIENTLLLRADIHTLFDRGLLSVCPDTLRVNLAPTMRGSAYGKLEGRQVRLPQDEPVAWKENLKLRQRLCSA